MSSCSRLLLPVSFFFPLVTSRSTKGTNVGGEGGEEVVHHSPNNTPLNSQGEHYSFSLSSSVTKKQKQKSPAVFLRLASLLSPEMPTSSRRVPRCHQTKSRGLIYSNIGIIGTTHILFNWNILLQRWPLRVLLRCC